MFARKSIYLMLVLAVFTLLASACTAPEPTAVVSVTAPPSEPAAGGAAGISETGSMGAFLEGLQYTGADIEVTGEVQQEFFSVTGQSVRINDAEIQVFEYPDVAAREAESSQISPDGSSVGNTMITWTDQPNFWANERLIVLYLGSDPATLDLLNEALGEPITQHS